MIKVAFFTFNPLQENTYLLSNEKGDTLIIDPGCYFEAEKIKLENYISQNGLKPVQLLNTHAHIDHIFGNKWIADTYGLEVYMHPAEKVIVETSPALARMFGLEYNAYTGIYHYLQEEDILPFGENELKVIEAPGHSPGSICFYCEEQHFIISGDVLFFESIGRSDLHHGSGEQLLQSIQNKLYTLPEETIVYPGHGPSTTIEHEKKHNPFLKETA